jgi:hypothetical protein
LEIGRVVRKPTWPMPIHTPNKELVTATLSEKNAFTNICPVELKKKCKDAQCQTNPLYYTESTYDANV